MKRILLLLSLLGSLSIAQAMTETKAVAAAAHETSTRPQQHRALWAVCCKYLDEHATQESNPYEKALFGPTHGSLPAWRVSMHYYVTHKVTKTNNPETTRTMLRKKAELAVLCKKEIRKYIISKEELELYNCKIRLTHGPNTVEMHLAQLTGQHFDNIVASKNLTVLENINNCRSATQLIELMQGLVQSKLEDTFFAYHALSAATIASINKAIARLTLARYKIEPESFVVLATTVEYEKALKQRAEEAKFLHAEIYDDLEDWIDSDEGDEWLAAVSSKNPKALVPWPLEDEYDFAEDLIIDGNGTVSPKYDLDGNIIAAQHSQTERKNESKSERNKA